MKQEGRKSLKRKDKARKKIEPRKSNKIKAGRMRVVGKREKGKEKRRGKREACEKEEEPGGKDKSMCDGGDEREGGATEKKCAEKMGWKEDD